MKFKDCKEVVDFYQHTDDMDRLCDFFDQYNMWSSLMGSRRCEVVPEGFFERPPSEMHLFETLGIQIDSDSGSAFGALVRNMVLIIDAGGRDAYITKKREEQADGYSKGSFLKM